MKRNIILLALLSIILSCGSDDNSPSISNLVISNDTVSQGSGSVIVLFSLKYSDPNGDIETIVVAKDGEERTAEVDTNGQTSGTIAGSIIVDTTEAGKKTGDVFAIDEEGNESNHLEFEITVEDD